MTDVVISVVIGLLIISVPTIALMQMKRKTDFYNSNIGKWTSEFEEYLPILDFITNLDIYLMEETHEVILIKYAIFPELFRRYVKHFSKWKYSTYINTIKALFSNDFLEEYNQKFIDKQMNKKHIKELLSNIDNKSLDNMQREVVLTEERNTLVVAGAGSGKTLTISGKVLYLTKELNIKPKEILLVTFTNKASEEMKERISEKLGIETNVYTFHKLGLEIITKKKGVKPTICEEGLLSDIISGYLEEDIFNDPIKSSILLDFFSYYFYTPFDEDEFNNLTDYFTEIKSNQLETLKNQIDGYEYIKEKLDSDKLTLNKERVKSYEELALANFLYLNGVNYDYEKRYHIDLATEKYMQYKPDFYLPDYNIYIEHYGITRDYKVPWLKSKMEQEYLRKIKWKRELHESEGNNYIETYSYLNREGTLLNTLKDSLVEYGVEFNPKDKSTVLKQLVDKDRFFYDEFQKLISTFINQYKVNGYASFDELELKAEKLYRDSTRSSLFLKLVEPIYNKYQQYLKENELIDFNDMINDATELVIESDYKYQYKYIIVDEYQDISNTRYKLIDAIRKNANSKLIVVGDDWQSIYRFAGSDVNLINDFELNNEKKTITRSLEKTYRNSQSLLNIVGEFIMKNDSQRKKHLYSDKVLENPIKIIPYEQDKLKAIEEAVNDIVDKFDNVNEILLLGRYNFDNKLTIDDRDVFVDYYLRRKYKGIKFTFLTVHKSKGLEGQHVIMINLENSKLGFPSKISDDTLLELVLPKKEQLRYAEERRLFYVALTRTKNSVYLIAPKKNPSIFVRELCDDGILPDVFNDNVVRCPKCEGTMVIRENNFYGCLNYPICDHTVDINANLNKVCPSCGDYLVMRSSKFGTFYGCNSYKYLNDPVKGGCSSKE